MSDDERAGESLDDAGETLAEKKEAVEQEEREAAEELKHKQEILAKLGEDANQKWSAMEQAGEDMNTTQSTDTTEWSIDSAHYNRLKREAYESAEQFEHGFAEENHARNELKEIRDKLKRLEHPTGRSLSDAPED